MDCFPLEVFNHMINIGVLIYDLFVWSGRWRCSVFWEYLVYLNMVSELLWRVCFDFDQDMEPVLLKIWKGFWFYIFYTFVAYGRCSIAFGASFSLGNSFRFIENYLCFLQICRFHQIWRYNVIVMVFLLNFFKYIIFISFIIRYLLF